MGHISSVGSTGMDRFSLSKSEPIISIGIRLMRYADTHKPMVIHADSPYRVQQMSWKSRPKLEFFKEFLWLEAGSAKVAFSRPDRG
jgi:hypothetical protein